MFKRLFYKIFNIKMNTENIAQLVADGALLVDVRRPDEFAEGHVAGSINIEHNTILAHTAQLKEANHIIVFCRSGNRSGMAKAMLENVGFTNVTNGGTWKDMLPFGKIM